MPMPGRASITVDAEVYDRLNDARKQRGETWDAYLSKASVALEADHAPVRVMEVGADALEEIAARSARETVAELERSQGAPW